MRSFGSGAIWSMVVPYCMIHYGKPYLEASSAVIAGVVLGSLAMRTRSIYAGFLVHATVAVTMDILALDHRHGLPTLLTPGELDAPRVPALARGHLDRVGARARGAGGEGPALVAGGDGRFRRIARRG